MKKAEGGGDFAVAMTAAEKQRFLDGISIDFGLYYNMLGSGSKRVVLLLCN